MANGLLDFFTGGGQYADPSQIDPNTGAPYGAVRQAFFNQLGNVGALLMAAGQPIDPSVRAQLIAQAGNFGSGMSSDIYRSAQSRLMQTQLQGAQQEQQRIQNIGQRIKDPEFLKSLNLTRDQAEILGPKGVAEILEKKITQDPLKLGAQQAVAEILGTGSPAAVPATPTEAKQLDAAVTSPQVQATGAGPNISDIATQYRRIAADPRVARGNPALAEQYAKLATALEDKIDIARRTAEAQELAKLPFELVEVQDAQGRKFKVPKAQVIAGAGPVPPTPAEEEVFKKKAVSALEKEQLFPRAQVNYFVTNRKADDLAKRTDEALALVDKAMTTGLTGAAFRNVPGSSAYDLRQSIDTLVANIGFDELQAMRDASPTGGALGQVAIKEIDLLQKVRGSLDPNQKEATIRKNLEDFKKNLEQLREERRRAFKADFGRDPDETPGGTGQPAAGGFRILNVTPPQQRQ